MAYIEECSLNSRQSLLLSNVYKSRLVPQALVQSPPAASTVSLVKERQG
jgi:hypothetical protein